MAFKYDTRKNGLSKECFPNVEIYYDELADENIENPWIVVSCGKEKKVYTVKEQTAKNPHYYVNVEMVVNGQSYKNRGMPLAQLIWVKYLKRKIAPGCVIDHIDEDSLNNSPDNLQMLCIGDNVRKTWQAKKK